MIEKHGMTSVRYVVGLSQTPFIAGDDCLDVEDGLRSLVSQAIGPASFGGQRNIP